MSEIRFDKVTGDSVIVSPERGKRPHDFKLSPSTPSNELYKESCPFCLGNEDKTPVEVLEYKDEVNNTWKVRVVTNLYSSLKKDTALEIIEDNFYKKVSAAGAAEVLIETPYHNHTLGKHSHKQTLDIIKAIKERYSILKEDSRIQHIQVFKNFGQVAGASQEHSHWQIMATPIIPKKFLSEIENLKEYFKEHRTCVYCDILKNESKEQERVIFESEKFLVFCPYASKYPYETMIVPKQHNSHFEEISDEEMNDLANAIHELIAKIENKFDYPPYNIVLNTMPTKMGKTEYYHWSLKIGLRLSIEAGFEMGTGIIVNPTPPELAAKILREP